MESGYSANGTVLANAGDPQLIYAERAAQYPAGGHFSDGELREMFMPYVSGVEDYSVSCSFGTYLSDPSLPAMDVDGCLRVGDYSVNVTIHLNGAVFSDGMTTRTLQANLSVQPRVFDITMASTAYLSDCGITTLKSFVNELSDDHLNNLASEAEYEFYVDGASQPQEYLSTRGSHSVRVLVKSIPGYGSREQGRFKIVESMNNLIDLTQSGYQMTARVFEKVVATMQVDGINTIRWCNIDESAYVPANIFPVTVFINGETPMSEDEYTVSYAISGPEGLSELTAAGDYQVTITVHLKDSSDYRFVSGTNLKESSSSTFTQTMRAVRLGLTRLCGDSIAYDEEVTYSAEDMVAVSVADMPLTKQPEIVAGRDYSLMMTRNGEEVSEIGEPGLYQITLQSEKPGFVVAQDPEGVTFNIRKEIGALSPVQDSGIVLFADITDSAQHSNRERTFREGGYTAAELYPLTLICEGNELTPGPNKDYEVSYTIKKDGVQCSEIKDVGVYTIKPTVTLSDPYKNDAVYAFEDPEELEFTVNQKVVNAKFVPTTEVIRLNYTGTGYLFSDVIKASVVDTDDIGINSDKYSVKFYEYSYSPPAGRGDDRTMVTNPTKETIQVAVKLDDENYTFDSSIGEEYCEIYTINVFNAVPVSKVVFPEQEELAKSYDEYGYEISTLLPVTIEDQARDTYTVSYSIRKGDEPFTGDTIKELGEYTITAKVVFNDKDLYRFDTGVNDDTRYTDELTKEYKVTVGAKKVVLETACNTDITTGTNTFAYRSKDGGIKLSDALVTNCKNVRENDTQKVPGYVYTVYYNGSATPDAVNENGDWKMNKAGTYKIVLTLADTDTVEASNYSIENGKTEISVQVEQRGVTVSHSYTGGTAPDLTYKGAGFAISELVTVTVTEDVVERASDYYGSEKLAETNYTKAYKGGDAADGAELLNATDYTVYAECTLTGTAAENYTITKNGNDQTDTDANNLAITVKPKRIVLETDCNTDIITGANTFAYRSKDGGIMLSEALVTSCHNESATDPLEVPGYVYTVYYNDSATPDAVNENGDWKMNKAGTYKIVLTLADAQSVKASNYCIYNDKTEIDVTVAKRGVTVNHSYFTGATEPVIYYRQNFTVNDDTKVGAHAINDFVAVSVTENVVSCDQPEYYGSGTVLTNTEADTLYSLTYHGGDLNEANVWDAGDYQVYAAATLTGNGDRDYQITQNGSTTNSIHLKVLPRKMKAAHRSVKEEGYTGPGNCVYKDAPHVLDNMVEIYADSTEPEQTPTIPAGETMEGYYPAIHIEEAELKGYLNSVKFEAYCGSAAYQDVITAANTYIPTEHLVRSDSNYVFEGETDKKVDIAPDSTTVVVDRHQVHLLAADGPVLSPDLDYQLIFGVVKPTMTLKGEAGEKIYVTVSSAAGTLCDRELLTFGGTRFAAGNNLGAEESIELTMKGIAGTTKSTMVIGSKTIELESNTKYTIKLEYDDINNLYNGDTYVNEKPKTFERPFYWDAIAPTIEIFGTDGVSVFRNRDHKVTIHVSEACTITGFTVNDIDRFVDDTNMDRTGGAGTEQHDLNWGFESLMTSGDKVVRVTAVDLVGNTVEQTFTLERSSVSGLIMTVQPVIETRAYINNSNPAPEYIRIIIDGVAGEPISVYLDGNKLPLNNAVLSYAGGGEWRADRYGTFVGQISVADLPKFTEFTLTASYNDVSSASDSTSLIYDNRVDPITLLTNPIREDCRVISLLAERGSSLLFYLNGDRINLGGNPDSSGLYVATMPYVMQGDILRIVCTDLAGNVKAFEYPVLEEAVASGYDGFMMGRVVTSSKDDDSWVMAYAYTVDELRSGVKLPLVAANAFVYGEATLRIDEEGVASVEYTLEDGAVVNSEYIGLSETLDVQDFVYEIPGNTVDTKDGKKRYWVCYHQDVELKASLVRDSYMIRRGTSIEDIDENYLTYLEKKR